MKELILWTEWDQEKDINGSILYVEDSGATNLIILDAPTEIELVRLLQDELLEEYNLKPSNYVLRLKPISEKPNDP